MRRLAACLVLPLVLAAAPPAGAQSQGGVVLRLVHQTPWNDPRHTTLDLTVRAANGTAQTLDDLSVNITIDAKLPNRTLNLTGTVAAMKPNFLRVELKGTPAMLFVADGKEYHVQTGDRYEGCGGDPHPDAGRVHFCDPVDQCGDALEDECG